MTKANKPVSLCCKKELITCCDDEGTCHYECNGCLKPCDIDLPPQGDYEISDETGLLVGGVEN